MNFQEIFTTCSTDLLFGSGLLNLSIGSDVLPGTHFDSSESYPWSSTYCLSILLKSAFHLGKSLEISVSSVFFPLFYVSAVAGTLPISRDILDMRYREKKTTSRWSSVHIRNAS